MKRQNEVDRLRVASRSPAKVKAMIDGIRDMIAGTFLLEDPTISSDEARRRADAWLDS